MWENLYKINGREGTRIQYPCVLVFYRLSKSFRFFVSSDMWCDETRIYKKIVIEAVSLELFVQGNGYPEDTHQDGSTRWQNSQALLSEILLRERWMRKSGTSMSEERYFQKITTPEVSKWSLTTKNNQMKGVDVRNRIFIF